MTTATQEAEPYGVSQTTTPGGLSIYYQAGPKRLYKISHPNPYKDADEDAGTFWHEVPSVSTITDALPKFLENWGCKVGIEGMQVLAGEGVDISNGSVEDLFAVLKERKLTPYYKKESAGTRGTNVHKAMELWAETGTTPDPQFYPENERGYVAGLVAFINDAHPHPLASELMVASLDGYAGRFDLLANLDFADNVITKLYPKREPKRSAVSGVWLLDFKTSSGIYESHKVQVAAYAHAYEECGYGLAPDHLGVVRLTPDGKYELVESHATYEDFQAVRATYDVLQRLKK